MSSYDVTRRELLAVTAAADDEALSHEASPQMQRNAVGSTPICSWTGRGGALALLPDPRPDYLTDWLQEINVGLGALSRTGLCPHAGPSRANFVAKVR